MKNQTKSKLTIFFSSYLICFLGCFFFKNLIINYNLELPTNPFLDFSYLKNTGAAFSIFENFNLILAIFALFVMSIAVYYVIKNIHRFGPINIIAFIFLLSGITSNMLERLIDGYVTDYIKLNFINFPVFNLSDLCINIGALILIIAILKNKKDKNE